MRKFRERHALPLAEARDLFRETKKWLWLLARAAELGERGGRRPPRLAVEAPLLLLDEMWHVFILFTREYTDYCQRCFGRYIHHAPTTRADLARLRRRARLDPAGARREELAARRAQYEFVYDQLGAATLRKWYAEYPARYPPDFVARIGRQ